MQSAPGHIFIVWASGIRKRKFDRKQIVKAKRCCVALLSALALMPAEMKLSAEPVIFFFSGQITERRAQNSVFTEPNSDTFYGYFSYDTAATPGLYNLYALLSFSIDGNSLNFTNGAPPVGLPGISLSSSTYPMTLDTMTLHGFYPPAYSGPSDVGDIAIWLVGSTGFAFTTNGLPSTLNLSSFRLAYLRGPVWGGGQPPGLGPFDRGTITQLIQVPEPAAWGTLSLGLAVYYRKWRTRSRTTRTEP